MNRQELAALVEAIATLLTWPPAVLDEVTRWLSLEAVTAVGHKSDRVDRHAPVRDVAHKSNGLDRHPPEVAIAPKSPKLSQGRGPLPSNERRSSIRCKKARA